MMEHGNAITTAAGKEVEREGQVIENGSKHSKPLRQSGVRAKGVPSDELSRYVAVRNSFHGESQSPMLTRQPWASHGAVPSGGNQITCPQGAQRESLASDHQLL